MISLKRRLTLGVCFLFILPLFASLFTKTPVLAAGESYSFANATTISGTGGAYTGTLSFRQTSSTSFAAAFPVGKFSCGLTITNVAKATSGGGYTGTLVATSLCPDNITTGPIKIADPNGVGPNGGNPGGGGSGGTAADDTKPSCESEGGAMSWIMCPLIRMLDGALNLVDTYIKRLLEVDSTYYNNAGMKAAWATFRNIAYIILVPIMLVMVIATALGFDFINAYTVKRALPRLVVAVIFIALSFNICVFLIELFNAIGQGTLGIITYPFSAAMGDVGSLNLSDLFASNILEGIFLQFIVGGIGLLLGLWFFGGTILLMAGIAFLVLIIRQILIVVLILAAPIAILSWIFPGNDRLWKSWWSLFTKLLIMYPLIMALIAVGRVFAFTVHESNAAGLDGTFLQPVMTLIAWMIPYGLVPITFTFAGGLWALVAGKITDGSQGLLQRQRQKRAERGQRFKEGNAFKGGTATNLRGQLNTALATGANAGALGYNPTRWRARMNKRLRDTSILGREKMLQDEEYTWRNNDTLNALAALTNDEAELRALAQRTGATLTESQVADVEHLRRKYGNAAFRQAAWRRAAAGGATFDRPDANNPDALGNVSVWEAAAMASGGDRSVLADLVGTGRGEMLNAGRVDEGGGSFNDTWQTAERFLTGVVDPATGQRRAYTADEARRDLTRAVYAQQGAGVLMHPSMKAAAMDPLVARMAEDVQDGVASGRSDDLAHALASVAFAYDTGTNPDKTRILRDRVMTDTIDVRQLTPEMREMLAPAITQTDANGVQSSRLSITVREAIEAARGSGTFQDFKREFQSTVYQQQAAQAARQQPPGPGGPTTGAQTGAPTGP